MLGEVARRDSCFNLARLILQIPVAAEAGVAGEVIGGGDIGAGQLRQGIDEQLAVFGGGEVAAVDQKIARLDQCVTPCADRLGFLLQRFQIKGGVTQPDLALAAVTDQMDRVESLVLLQSLADLIQAISIAIKQHNLETAIIAGLADQLIHQGLIIGRGGIDDDQFGCRPFLLMIRAWRFLGQGGFDGLNIRCLHPLFYVV